VADSFYGEDQFRKRSLGEAGVIYVMARSEVPRRGGTTGGQISACGNAPGGPADEKAPRPGEWLKVMRMPSAGIREGWWALEVEPVYGTSRAKRAWWSADPRRCPIFHLVPQPAHPGPGRVDANLARRAWPDGRGFMG